jgi:hypothetical protein
MTLAEFLAARLDEDEATARDATPGPWRWVDPGRPKIKLALVGDGGLIALLAAQADAYPSTFDAAHIVRHDPARALAEVEAKRQILDMCAEVIAAHPDADDWPAARARAGVLRAVGGDHMSLAEDVIAALALPYADHPDYDPAWRPE